MPAINVGGGGHTAPDYAADRLPDWEHTPTLRVVRRRAGTEPGQPLPRRM